MSILLLLLLLLLSVHASDARLLRNDTTKQVDQPSKENEKLVAARVWNELPNNDIRDIAKDSDNEAVDEAKGAKRSEEERVSWKVPDEKKGGEPQAGFNLDYLPPKTHPPVHN